MKLRTQYYKLSEDKQTPVPVDDVMEWANSMEDEDRIVAFTELPNEAQVSTVFLGLDHNFTLEGPPILWETMVFGGTSDGWERRCSGTREDALKMHNAMIESLEIPTTIYKF